MIAKEKKTHDNVVKKLKAGSEIPQFKLSPELTLYQAEDPMSLEIFRVDF